MIRSLSIALVALAAGNALAATPIDDKRPVSADVRVEISNVKGAVTVSGWDRNEIAIGGSLGDGAKPLKIEGSERDVHIKVESDGQSGWFSWGSDSRMGPTNLDVKVPRAAALKINVVSANTTVSGVNGETLEIDSVSGKLRLESSARKVRIDSVSGNIELVGKTSDANLETVSGDIRARGLGGTLRYETVSGDIDAEHDAARDIQASTVSGDISLRGTVDGKVRMGIESMSGSVRLSLPENLAARLRASSFSGKIRSDFGRVERKEFGPGSSLDATLGSGAGEIRVESFSGDVDLRRD